MKLLPPYLLSLQEGLLLGLILILAIAVQHLWITRQSLARGFVLSLLLIVTLSNFVLWIVEPLAVDRVLFMVRWALLSGIFYSLFYGATSRWNRWRGRSSEIEIAYSAALSTTYSPIVAAIGFTLFTLQPILDMMILMGALAGRYLDRQEAIGFIAGIATALMFYFFSLLYATSLLAPTLRRPLRAALLELMASFLIPWVIFSLLLYLFYAY